MVLFERLMDPWPALLVESAIKTDIAFCTKTQAYRSVSFAPGAKRAVIPVECEESKILYQRLEERLKRIAPMDDGERIGQELTALFYNIGDSLPAHRDNNGKVYHDGKPYLVSYTALWYFSIGLVGGELRFTESGLSTPAQSGDLVIFSGNEQHEMTKVLAGERRALMLRRFQLLQE